MSVLGGVLERLGEVDGRRVLEGVEDAVAVAVAGGEAVAVAEGGDEVVALNVGRGEPVAVIVREALGVVAEEADDVETGELRELDVGVLAAVRVVTAELAAEAVLESVLTVEGKATDALAAAVAVGVRDVVLGAEEVGDGVAVAVGALLGVTAADAVRLEVGGGVAGARATPRKTAPAGAEMRGAPPASHLRVARTRPYNPRPPVMYTVRPSAARATEVKDPSATPPEASVGVYGPSCIQLSASPPLPSCAALCRRKRPAHRSAIHTSPMLAATQPRGVASAPVKSASACAGLRTSRYPRYCLPTAYSPAGLAPVEAARRKRVPFAGQAEAMDPALAPL